MRRAITVLLEKRRPTWTADRLDLDAAALLEIIFQYRQQMPPISHALAGEPHNLGNGLVTALAITDREQRTRHVFVPYQGELELEPADLRQQVGNRFFRTARDCRQEWRPQRIGFFEVIEPTRDRHEAHH